MKSLPRVLNFDDVIELCGSVATSRGRVYKTNGSVRELEWQADAQVLFSEVQGSAREPYRQRITIAPHRLEGECSCPVSLNCKHVAASLLCWIDEQTSAPGADDQTLRAVNRWLQRMVDRGRHGSQALDHHEPGEPLLFYQLDESSLAQHQKGITLQVLQSRLLKRGGFGKETPYRYHGHYHHPDWVTATDRAILEMAVGRNNDFTYRTLTIEGDIGHLLMGKLIATRRCYWGEDREQPLALGDDGTLEFDWRTGEDDLMRLEVSLDVAKQWQLVPADPPWYIARQGLLAGQLRQVPAVTLLEDLLSAPPLPAANAQAVSNYLASRLPEARLPLPLEPDFVRVSVPPRPVLLLQSRDDSADIRHFFATIRFRYDDYVLPFAGMEADGSLEGKTADGRPLVLKRDLVGETRHVVDFGKRFTDFEAAQGRDPKFFSKADRLPRSHDVQSIARSWQQVLDAQPELEAEGWRVQTREPFDLNFNSVTRIEATVSETTSNWFDMALKLEYGKQTFDLLPLVVDWLQSDQRDQSILLQAQDGEWLEIAPDVFKPVADTLLELFDDPSRETQARNGELRLPRQRAATLDTLDAQWQGMGVNVSWRGAGELFATAEKLRNFEGIDPVALPDAMEATLRQYQHEGVSWLGFLAEYGFNGILADDMGLGKTVQTLAHILHERSIGRLTAPTLIVAPTSLLVNWQREIARFTPTLSCAIWHGTDRKARGIRFDQVDILVTSYALVTRDIELLDAQNFGCVVLDEAQSIKNPTAKVTQALKTLHVRRRICLSGTPMENHLGELWSLFDFLMPGFLGSRKHFNRYFRNPIETHGSVDRQQRLATLVRPFLLRRKKEQVASELPPKTEIVREVTLEGAQARLYESIRVSMEHRVQQLLRERGVARSHIEMLDALLKLRQTCCHPALVKLDTARGIVESAKTELLLSMLDELIAEGKKILLFSQFTEMLGILEVALAERQIPYVKLTGRTRNRAEVVDTFQHGDVPLFLISLKAGGTGLNLTAADTVIHYDPWWNPAVENQASDRAHRIGQTKPVFIYRLVASNTVEEKILAMQAYKQQLSDQTVSRSEPLALKNLTADDILSLFAADDASRHVA